MLRIKDVPHPLRNPTQPLIRSMHVPRGCRETRLIQKPSNIFCRRARLNIKLRTRVPKLMRSNPPHASFIAKASQSEQVIRVGKKPAFLIQNYKRRKKRSFTSRDLRPIAPKYRISSYPVVMLHRILKHFVYEGVDVLYGLRSKPGSSDVGPRTEAVESSRLRAKRFQHS